MSLVEMLLIVCPLVFFASLVDAIAGGGGLISLPAYMLSGMPAHLAIGSNKLSAAIGTIFSTARFMKSGSFHLRVALQAAVAAVVGSVTGAVVALYLSDYYLRLAMLILLPCAAVFVLCNQRQINDESRTDRISGSKMFFLAVVVGFGMGCYDGFFGPGTGTFLIIAFTALMGFDLKTACGNTKIVNLTTNLSALAVFILAGQVAYQVALPAAAFSIAGHWLGSGLAIKNGARFIKPVMAGVLFLLLCKLVWDFLA